MKRTHYKVLFIAIIAIGQSSYSSDKDSHDEKTPSENHKIIPTATNPTKVKEWSTMAKVGAGIAGAAVVAGAVHLYDPHAFSYLAEQTNNLVNWLGGAETKNIEQTSIQSNDNASNLLKNESQTQQNDLPQIAKEEQDHIAEQTHIKTEEETASLALQAQLEQEEQERIAEQIRMEAARIAIEKEKARLALQAQLEQEEQDRIAEQARMEAARIAIEEEKARLALQAQLEQEKQERIAEQARMEAARVAAEKEKARLAEEVRIEAELHQASLAHMAQRERERAQLRAEKTNELIKFIGGGALAVTGLGVAAYNAIQSPTPETKTFSAPTSSKNNTLKPTPSHKDFSQQSAKNAKPSNPAKSAQQSAKKANQSHSAQSAQQPQQKKRNQSTAKTASSTEKNNLDEQIASLLLKEKNIALKHISDSLSKSTASIKTIHAEIFAISQNQYDSNPANFILANGPMLTPQQYLMHAYFNNNQDVHLRIENNLKDYKLITDARGDGNCGYRAFIISALMNNLETMPDYFIQLIDNNFITLFNKYDIVFENFPYEQWINIPTALIKYLRDTLKNIKKVLSNKNNDESLLYLERTFNSEVIFDYYMIMFMRFLLIDYLKNNEKNPDIIDLDTIYASILSDINDHNNRIRRMPKNGTSAQINQLIAIPKNEYDAFDMMLDNLKIWGNEIDEIGIRYLPYATHIRILKTKENAVTRPTEEFSCDNQIGTSYILHTTNHYKILIK